MELWQGLTSGMRNRRISFLDSSHPDNPAPPLDTYSHCHLSSNTETLITRATGPAALVDLLPAADDAFRRRCPRRYGPTYHTRTPRQWAVQLLGLNITRAYARHLNTCRTRLSSPSTTPNPGYGSLSRYPTM